MTLKLHITPKAQDEKVAVCIVAFERPVVDLKVPISLCACLEPATEARTSWSGTPIGFWAVYILKSGTVASGIMIGGRAKHLFECDANLNLGT